MNSDVPPTLLEEECAALLAVCDDLLAQGTEPLVPEDSSLSPEVKGRLLRGLDCLRRLENVWPRRSFPTEQRAGNASEGTSPVANASGSSWRADLPGYQILEELGRGGMGVVYKARQIGLNRLVALKMIPVAGASSQTRARFHTEAVAAGRLQHPHIVQIHDVGEHHGQPYYSLELVQGGTLAQKLAGQPQPADEAARLVETLARAVSHAHQNGIIHRDLKPANILLSADGTPKISDFGLAKSLEDDNTQTRTGTIVGTPNYMAPEQANGSLSEVGPVADIYALGVILYEMLTGRPPFCGRTPLETLEMVRTQEAVPPRHLQPATPRDLETICLQCLAKEPGKRYASALDLADDLARFRAGKPIHARPVHALERGWRWCRRNPVPAALLACVALLLVGIATVSSLAAWKLEHARDQAVANQREAEQAKEETKEQLWNALLSQARANRWSGRVGRNFDSLDTLTRAAAVRPSLELRNEAIACMALPDLRLVRQWDVGIPRYGLAIDAELERYAFSDERGTISIRRFSDNRELLRLPGGGVPAWFLQFSPDGRFLAARCFRKHGDTRTFLVWDIAKAVRTGEMLAAPLQLSGRNWDFDPNKPYVTSNRPGGLLQRYDLTSGGPPAFLNNNERANTCLTFAPDGRRLAAAENVPFSAAGEKVYRLFVYDAETGKSLFRLLSPAMVYRIAWREDGRQLAAAAEDSNVYVWEPPAERPVKTLMGHQNAATRVAFHPGGELLASIGWDDALRLWDVETGRQLLSSPASSGPLRFSRDGRRLALSLDEARLGLYDFDLGGVCRSLRSHSETGKRPLNTGFWNAAFHPDKPLIVTTSNHGVDLWDAASGLQIADQPLPDCQSAFFLPEGDLLTSSSSGLERWRLTAIAADDKGRPRLERLPWTGPAMRGTRRMALAGDGRTLAVLVGYQKAVLLERNGWAERWPNLNEPDVAFIALSPDGRWAATGTWHGNGTRIWDLNSGQPVGKELPGGDAFVAFSPNGQWLVNGTQDEFRFWEVGSWRPGLSIPRTPPAVAGPLAFTTDGKIVAIAHSLREVRLIETATGRELATLAAPEPHPINWLCFRPDGEQLAVACENRVLQLWDLRRIRERLEEMGLDWE